MPAPGTSPGRVYRAETPWPSDVEAPISGLAGEELQRVDLSGLSPHRLAALEQPT